MQIFVFSFLGKILILLLKLFEWWFFFERLQKWEAYSFFFFFQKLIIKSWMLGLCRRMHKPSNANLIRSSRRIWSKKGIFYYFIIFDYFTNLKVKKWEAKWIYYTQKQLSDSFLLVNGFWENKCMDMGYIANVCYI